MPDGNGLTFITHIKYTQSLLDEINHLTFLFDTNWNINNSVVSTMPICTFRVQTCEEVMTSEVSTKQMLFYNSSNAVSSAKQTSGLLNVVADNIVIRPKQYKMKVLIPANNFFMPIGSVLFNQAQATAMLNAMTGTEGFNKSVAEVASVMDSPITQIFLGLIKDLFLTWDVKSGQWGTDVEGNDFNSWFQSVIETPMFNKNSLEAMWRNRSILKMKTWDSWRYKYVAITDCFISKDPVSNGVYEGTITVQEMPILNVARSGGNKVTGFKNNRAEVIGQSIKTVIDSQEVTNGY